MDRKKFVAVISTGILGAFLLKTSLLKFAFQKNKSEKNNPVKVKLNPNAVNRVKSGK